jgi:hypothetical protein
MSICCFYELQTTPVGMIIGDKKLKVSFHLFRSIKTKLC